MSVDIQASRTTTYSVHRVADLYRDNRRDLPAVQTSTMVRGGWRRVVVVTSTVVVVGLCRILLYWRACRSQLTVHTRLVSRYRARLVTFHRRPLALSEYWTRPITVCDCYASYNQFE